jgi:hypothetical protein
MCCHVFCFLRFKLNDYFWQHSYALVYFPYFGVEGGLRDHLAVCVCLSVCSCPFGCLRSHNVLGL